MKKTLPDHPLSDRKNNFRIWVKKFRTNNISNTREPLKLKSVYIRKSNKNLRNNPQKWDSAQLNYKDRYLEKIKLMEEIRQRKIERQTINFIVTPRYEYPQISAGK